MVCFARYFKQGVVDNVRADVDLVIRRGEGPGVGAAAPKPKRARTAAAAAATNNAAVDPLEIHRFPAHSIILNESDYFRAQGARWQEDTHVPATPKAGSGSSSSSSAAHAMRPAVHLTIDGAEQLPAAEAVIAAMYGVPDAMSSLEQQQAVHAVVLADMVNVEGAGQQAMQALQAAAKSEQGLAAAARAALKSLPVWPACLLQLLPSIVEQAPCCRDSTATLAAVTAADVGGRTQQLLVAALGDLQAVWSDAQQQALLLGLPLPAMLLLLSSDQLRVPSEDTVLYTAKRYVQAQNIAANLAAAKAALAPLVRAPQLSLFALSCAALPAASAQQLLGSYAQKLRDLLPLRYTASAAELTAELEVYQGVPVSWQRGPRQIKPLQGGVRLEWQLPLEQLQQAFKDSAAQQKTLINTSPSSPPFGGVAWSMKVVCAGHNGGTLSALCVGPAGTEVPDSICFRCSCTVSWLGGKCTRSTLRFARHRVVLVQTFHLPPMVGGGWDEAAWAAAGLPTAGDTLLELQLHSVA